MLSCDAKYGQYHVHDVDVEWSQLKIFLLGLTIEQVLSDISTSTFSRLEPVQIQVPKSSARTSSLQFDKPTTNATLFSTAVG